MKEMFVPILAGILSTLRRVIARRVSLKNQLKRRLHAITFASATCFLFPVAMWDMIIGSTSVELPFSAWAFSSFVLFGVILIFYVDSIAEERLHMVFSSPRHLMVAGGCILVMEMFYKMDFSLPGFVICCILLGFGVITASHQKFSYLSVPSKKWPAGKRILIIGVIGEFQHRSAKASSVTWVSDLKSIWKLGWLLGHFNVSPHLMVLS